MRSRPEPVGSLTEAADAGARDGPATDSLEIAAPPGFAKAFAPAAVSVGGVSVLTLTIDNGASALPANGLAFTDDLPAGMVVGTPANAATTCTGGTLIAAPGGTVVSYSGGSVGAGASCTVSVEVTGVADGVLVNSVFLTSTFGPSGAAEAALAVAAAPAVPVIPALGPWGVLALAALLALAAVRRLTAG